MHCIVDPTFDICVPVENFDQPVPVFPIDQYAQVVVTNLLACALSTDGRLLCLSLDSGNVATPPGRYSFLDAARDSVCAIRIDGTTACWRHDGDPWGYRYDVVTRLEPYTPAIDADW